MTEIQGMPDCWYIVANVNGQDILSIGDHWQSGRELSDAEERAIVGMARRLLSFVGHGLPPTGFDPDNDDEHAPK